MMDADGRASVRQMRSTCSLSSGDAGGCSVVELMESAPGLDGWLTRRVGLLCMSARGTDEGSMTISTWKGRDEGRVEASEGACVRRQSMA